MVCPENECAPEHAPAKTSVVTFNLSTATAHNIFSMQHTECTTSHSLDAVWISLKPETFIKIDDLHWQVLYWTALAWTRNHMLSGGSKTLSTQELHPWHPARSAAPTWASANRVMLSMLRRSSERTICSTSAFPSPWNAIVTGG